MNKENLQKAYWFYIETYVHISIKKDSLLLYNSLNGKALEYSGAPHRKILNLVKRLQSPGNLQVIRLKEKDLQDPIIGQFVRDLRTFFMGDLIDTSCSKGRPVQMMPIVKIQKDVKFLKQETSRSVGEDMIEYLSEIFLYINNECYQCCDMCIAAYKQFPCCTTAINPTGEPKQKKDLDLESIKSLFEEFTGSSTANLNVLGGNIFRYSKFKELTKIVNVIPGRKTFYSHYSNVIDEGGKLKLLDPNSSLVKILAPSPIDEEKLKIALDIVGNAGLNSKFIFVIQNEAEFEKAETAIVALLIDNYEYQPFYNGKNLMVFEENIFMDKEEILGAKPSLKDIYQNSVVNNLNFGRLTVLNNGHIYANVNASRLGILGKDSLYDVLYKEMYHGKSWRRIRKNLAPCKGCTFQALCPPTSNYSFAIGRNDLCFKFSIPP